MFRLDLDFYYIQSHYQDRDCERLQERIKCSAAENKYFFKTFTIIWLVYNLGYTSSKVDKVKKMVLKENQLHFEGCFGYHMSKITHPKKIIP